MIPIRVHFPYQKHLKFTMRIYVLLLLVMLMANCDQSTLTNRSDFIQPEKVSLSRELTISGVLHADQTLEMRPEITGQILEILVHEKDSVQQGQILFKVLPKEFLADIDSLQNLIQQAKSELKSKKISLEDIKKQLLDAKKSNHQKVASTNALYQTQIKELENARFKIIKLEEGLQIMQQNSISLDILAPNSGIIKKINVMENERVFKSKPNAHEAEKKVWAEFVGSGAFRLESETENPMANQVKKGTIAEVKLAFETTNFMGKVEKIRQVSSNKYQIITRLLKLDKNPKIKLGMTGTAKIKVQTDVLLIPVSCLQKTANAYFVHIKKDSTSTALARRGVEIGVRHKDKAEIQKGISEHDWIMVNPNIK